MASLNKNIEHSIEPFPDAELIDAVVKRWDERIAQVAKAPPSEQSEGPSAPLSQQLGDLVLRKPRWLIPDVLERGVVALMAGPRGSLKSFIAINWAMTVAVRDGLPVYAISAEGNDFRRRAEAWLQEFAPGRTAATVPLHVIERRIDLNAKANIDLIRADCTRLGIRPVLFLLDTLSKLSSIDENSNTEAKAFISRLDNGLKRAFDATVLLVAHTGHNAKDHVRGASALEADTDACYIATKDGMSVSVSRERFKESAELPPLTYAARVVNVAVGRETATSLVLDVSAVKPGSRRKRPTGANELAVLKTLEEHAPDAPIDQARVIELVIDAQGLGNSTRAQREGNIARTVREMLERPPGQAWIFSHGNNLIALSSAVAFSNLESGESDDA